MSQAVSHVKEKIVSDKKLMRLVNGLDSSVKA